VTQRLSRVGCWNGARVGVQACALVGPNGLAPVIARRICPSWASTASYARRSAFAVHDLGGLKVGYADLLRRPFPEAARVLRFSAPISSCLPDEWPTGAGQRCVSGTARALEKQHLLRRPAIEWAKSGVSLHRQSRLVAPNADLLASAPSSVRHLVAEIDPAVARNKRRLVKIRGKYELDRADHRRPVFVGPLCDR